MSGPEDKSSFVDRILEHAGQIEQNAIHDKLDVLTMKLSELQVEMHHLTELRYIHHLPLFQLDLLSARTVIQSVRDVQSQLSAIERKCQSEVNGQLYPSAMQSQSLNQKLSKATAILAGLTFIADVHDLFEISARCLEAKMYRGAATALVKLETYLKQPMNKLQLGDKIAIIGAMQTELEVQFARLECDLTDLWNYLVKWTITSSSEPGNETSVKAISISIASVGCCSSQLDGLIEDLYVSSLLVSKMKSFVSCFQKYLMPFVTENMQLTIAVKTINHTKTLCIGIQDKHAILKGGSPVVNDNSKDIAKKNMYTHVFGNLLKILEHLHTMFLHVEYGRHDASKLDAPSDSRTLDISSVSLCANKDTLMSLFGQHVSPWLIHLLQKTVLDKAVPTSTDDLKGFSKIIASTQLLQERMVELGFIQADNRSLLEYVQNVNVLFSYKTSQASLEAAHALITSDFNDTVAVAEDEPMGKWPSLTCDGFKESARQAAAADKLSDMCPLPKCRISVNIQALMALAYVKLNEVTESSPECATQMFYTVRSMFELFYHVVPTHHEHNFKSVPQFAALHHNNCMFIAHHLLTLGHQFALKLPTPESKTFVDIIQKIQHTGMGVIIAQVNRQRDLLLGYLTEADGFGNLEEKNQFVKADKAIKQVMLQLGHLQKMWEPVLPVEIYKMAMAQLINTVAVSVSGSVSSLVVITQDASHRLTSLLMFIEQECENLLASPGEVASIELIKHVPKWSRLMELKFMLRASLSEIADHWTDGTGPLALSYSLMEVKHMIGALFQKTDRSVNLLATIK